MGRYGEATHRVGVTVQALDPGQSARHRRHVEVVAHCGTLLLVEVGPQCHGRADVVAWILRQDGDAVCTEPRVGGQRSAYLRIPVPDQLRLQHGRETALIKCPPWRGQRGKDLARHGDTGVVGEQSRRTHRAIGVCQQSRSQRRGKVFPSGAGSCPHPGIGVGREAGEVVCGEPWEFGGLSAGRAGEEVVVQVTGKFDAPGAGILGPGHAPARRRLGADQAYPLVGRELGPEGVRGPRAHPGISMRHGGVEYGRPVATVQEADLHIQQPDQQLVRRGRVEPDPLRPVQRPCRPAGHRSPHLGALGLRLAPGSSGSLIQPLRQSVKGRHPRPFHAGHLRQQHLPVGGERHEPRVAGQPRHTAVGVADPGPPGVVAADPMSEDGHQELTVGICKAAPPRGVERFPGRTVRRRDPPRDPPAGLRREQAARAHVLDDRESGA